MSNWLKMRAEANKCRHEARAQPATRSSQRIAAQLSQAEEDEALTIAVGLLNSEEDDDMGDIEEEDSDDEDYTAGDSDHDNDKADEADDDYDYDSDDGRLEDDDGNIGEDDVGSNSGAGDEDLDCSTEDTSEGSDDSDYDSDPSEGDPTPRTPGGRDDQTNPPRPSIALGSSATTADSPQPPPAQRPHPPLAPRQLAPTQMPFCKLRDRTRENDPTPNTDMSCTKGTTRMQRARTPTANSLRNHPAWTDSSDSNRPDSSPPTLHFFVCVYHKFVFDVYTCRWHAQCAM